MGRPSLPPNPPPAASATAPPATATPPTISSTLPEPPFFAASGAPAGGGPAWAATGSPRFSCSFAASKASMTFGGNLSGLKVMSLNCWTAWRNFARAAAS